MHRVRCVILHGRKCDPPRVHSFSFGTFFLGSVSRDDCSLASEDTQILGRFGEERLLDVVR